MDKSKAKENFLSTWEEYITKLKGLLLRQKNDSLTIDSASSALNEVNASWRSEYDILGRWLTDFTKFDEEKGKEITSIIFEDIKFEEIKVMSNYKHKILDILPWAGAALGFGVSHLFKAGQTIQAVLTILPPALLLPATKKAKTDFGIQQSRNLIDEYLSQLDKYKNTIISIIES